MVSGTSARQYDREAEVIRFWEFDVFGGVTEGIVRTDGQDIWYEYEYGESRLTDVWELKDETTYKYTIGEHDGETWTVVYLETEFNKIE